eukprot:SAG31_NODE_22186_length_532_cov_0.591224_1_plen_39_part_10
MNSAALLELEAGRVRTGELGDESDWKARWAEPSNLRDSQ